MSATVKMFDRWKAFLTEDKRRLNIQCECGVYLMIIGERFLDNKYRKSSLIVKSMSPYVLAVRCQRCGQQVAFRKMDFLSCVFPGSPIKQSRLREVMIHLQDKLDAKFHFAWSLQRGELPSRTAFFVRLHSSIDLEMLNIDLAHALKQSTGPRASIRANSSVIETLVRSLHTLSQSFEEIDCPLFWQQAEQFLEGQNSREDAEAVILDIQDSVTVMRKALNTLKEDCRLHRENLAEQTKKG